MHHFACRVPRMAVAGVHVAWAVNVLVIIIVIVIIISYYTIIRFNHKVSSGETGE